MKQRVLHGSNKGTDNLARSVLVCLKIKTFPSVSVILGALVVTVVFSLTTRNRLKQLKTLEVLSLKYKHATWRKSNLQHKNQHFAFDDVIS